MRRALPLVLASCVAGSAQAQDGDGLYGRFDSAASVVFGAGARVDTTGTAGAEVDVRLRLLDSTGLVASFGFVPGERTRGFYGLEVRPFFPSLFLQSMWTGRPYLDLLLQGPGLELGVEMPLVADAPIGVAFGAYLDVPLVRPDRFAHGVALRLAYRQVRFLRDIPRNDALLDDSRRRTLFASLVVAFDAGHAIPGWEPTRHRHR